MTKRSFIIYCSAIIVLLMCYLEQCNYNHNLKYDLIHCEKVNEMLRNELYNDLIVQLDHNQYSQLDSLYPNFMQALYIGDYEAMWNNMPDVIYNNIYATTFRYNDGEIYYLTEFEITEHYYINSDHYNALLWCDYFN